MEQWVQESDRGALIRCYAQPGASRSEVVGIHGDRVKIRIKAPPTEGKANKELLSFLAKLLGVRKSSLHIVRGDISRSKDVLCEGLAVSIITECFELLYRQTE